MIITLRRIFKNWS